MIHKRCNSMDTHIGFLPTFYFPFKKTKTASKYCNKSIPYKKNHLFYFQREINLKVETSGWEMFLGTALKVFSLFLLILNLIFCLHVEVFQCPKIEQDGHVNSHVNGPKLNKRAHGWDKSSLPLGPFWVSSPVAIWQFCL